MVLVGPSGCGKTTALRMVAGLEDISSGVVRIGERTVNHVPSRDRDIAMVFQSYALYPHLSVYDNIAFGLRVKKMPKAEIDRRVRNAAQVLGLDPFLKRKPRALSGGQRQRVAMGRAIGGLAVDVGKQHLKLDESTLAARPALARYEGQNVILGIRPEDLEDASLEPASPADRRLRGVVELREALGSELMVHFTVEGTSEALTDDVKELAEDAGAPAEGPALE